MIGFPKHETCWYETYMYMGVSKKLYFVVGVMKLKLHVHDLSLSAIVKSCLCFRNQATKSDENFLRMLTNEVSVYMFMQSNMNIYILWIRIKLLGIVENIIMCDIVIKHDLWHNLYFIPEHIVFV